MIKLAEEIGQRYKYILSKLPETQLNVFIKLFQIDKTRAMYIIKQRYYNLFNSIIVCQQEQEYLKKINILSKLVSTESLQKLLKHINMKNINLVSKLNIETILKFIEYKQEFSNKLIPIRWGPGNHMEIKENIKNHYDKHILLSYEEGLHWKEILEEPTLENYRDYAINSFYKMGKVFVHANGRKVYLSGFVGNVFIIGRFHDDTFGISSCYYVESGEKSGRLREICFSLEFN